MSFDPESNDNVESALHDHKQDPPRDSTDAGMQIDCNDEQPRSAFVPIRVSFDPELNENDESELHNKKEESPRNSTEAGRQIDFNAEQ
jgi:hypothetical protein